MRSSILNIILMVTLLLMIGGATATSTGTTVAAQNVSSDRNNRQLRTRSLTGPTNRRQTCGAARRQGTLKPSGACSIEGLSCALSATMCYSVYEVDTSTCSDLILTNTCSCEDGNWMYTMNSCPLPDYRCNGYNNH